MTPKFLAYIVILCFEKRRPKQNSPYFTSLAIYQVMLNANDISGKAANKFKLTHFCKFVLISPIFKCLELNLLLRTANNSSNLTQSAATSFHF